MDDLLSDLRVQFLCGYPVRHMEWPEKLTNDIQAKVVTSTVRDPLLKNMPVVKSYTLSFMKELMSKIESCGQEIGDEVFEAYGDLLTQPAHDASYKHYIINNKSKEQIISLEESNTLIAEGTTGLVTWQASQRLAEYLLGCQTDMLTNRKIVELGCGLGFLGLVICAHFKCSEYIFTDHHSSVLQKLKNNLSLNKVLQCQPEIVELDWVLHRDSLPKHLTQMVQDTDIIIAADVVFDCTIIPPLVSILCQLLKHGSNGCQAYICSTIRNTDTYDTFKSCLSSMGLIHSTVEDKREPLFHYDRASPIEILQISLNSQLDVTKDN